MKPVQRAALAAAIVTSLAGAACAWVELSEGAEKVGILTEEAAQGCKRLGKTTANTTDSVVFIPRSEDKVKDELRRIARNSAARMGGDAIAPLGPVTDGEQEFGIYRCAPGEPASASTPAGSGD